MKVRWRDKDLISVKFYSFAACVLAASLLAAPAFAQRAAITPGTLSTGGSTGPFELGFSFTPNIAVYVSALGAFDSGSDGLSQSHVVSIWDANGTLLTSATVTNANGLSGQFRYAAITPYNLTAGSTYTIGASNFSAAAGQDNYALDTSRTVAPGITFNNGLEASVRTSDSVRPTVNDGSTGLYGANFLFVAGSAPEPASWMLMIGGFGLAGCALRRRRDGAGAAATA